MNQTGGDLSGEAVREWRRRLGRTQQAVAFRAGVDTKTVQNLESGQNVRRRNYLRIINALEGIEAGDEFVIEDDPVTGESSVVRRHRSTGSKDRPNG